MGCCDSAQRRDDIAKEEAILLRLVGADGPVRNRASAKKAKGFSSKDEVYTNKLIQIIQRLEEKKGRPVYICELYGATLNGELGEGVPAVGRDEMLSLYKDDLVMCSDENNSYSLNKSLQLCEESNPEGE